MAEPIYKLNDNPAYETEVRALQDSDPASASTTFNPLIETVLNNIHAVKRAGDVLKGNVEADGTVTSSRIAQNEAKILFAQQQTIELAAVNKELTAANEVLKADVAAIQARFKRIQRGVRA